MEIYYNGYLKGINIDKLLIKNGRVAWAPVHSANGTRYYASLATSKALSRMHLTEKDKHFAANPLQFSRRKMKKYFDLHFMDANKEYIHIRFSPRQDSSHYFSGEVWIDKNNNLLKIILNGKHINVYPFIPLHPSIDSLYDFGMNIQEVFKPVNGAYLPSYIDFNYQFSYKSDRTPFKFQSVVTNKYKTKGVLYFYNYSKPFILPYFDYDPTYSDYRKMSLIPYNNLFWANNNKVPITKTQKKDLNLLTKKGKSLNFNKSYVINLDSIKKVHDPYFGDFDSISPSHDFWARYNFIWNGHNRISVSKNLESNKDKIIKGYIVAPY